MKLTIEQIANLYMDISEKVITYQNALGKLLDITITKETRLEELKIMVSEKHNEAIEYLFSKFLEFYNAFKRIEQLYVDVDDSLEKYINLNS